MAIELCRLPRLLRRLVMIDGPPRAGKSSVSKILSSFERVELERIEEIYDYVGFLYGHRKIEHDAAVALLRAFADTHIYNLYLSRNINCRFGDQSSIFKSAKFWTYLRRMFEGEHGDATGRIEREEPIMQQHSHYQMEHINVHFDAFPEQLQVIEVLRHPLDLVPAFGERGYGENICESLYNVHLCARFGETAVHLLAHDWPEEWLCMSPMDRMIRMVHGYQMRSFKTFVGLSPARRVRVKVVVFEDVLTDPVGQAEALAGFMGTRTTAKTKKMIAQAGCPRPIPSAARDHLWARIKAECRPASVRLLEELVANYETRWAQAAGAGTGI